MANHFNFTWKVGVPVRSLTTIRDHLEDYLKRNSMTLIHFSEISGINSGTLSGMLNGLRPISMQQLDRITIGMGLPEGYFYDLYINECFVHTSPDWRRLRPFLYRCAELDKIECMETIIKLMMDNLAYAPLLFGLAEQLFHEGMFEAAKPLYYWVAESEKMQHSERLALSQYRLFTIGLSKDQTNNLSVATRFELFVDRLDEPYELDGLNELINAYASVRRWDKLLGLGEKLKLKASVHYELYGNIKPKEVKKEIIFYILYAYLVLGETYFYFEEYEKALHYVSLYTDSSWVIDPTEKEIIVIQQFKEWAEGNRYQYELMSGKTDVLHDYLNYISERENEVFPALCEIVVAANKFGLDIDAVLEKYESSIVYREQFSRIGVISSQLTGDRYANLLMGISIYYFQKNNLDKGFQFLLDSLSVSIEISSGLCMVKCVDLFEQYSTFATATTIEKFNKLKLKSKKIVFARNYIHNLRRSNP